MKNITLWHTSCFIRARTPVESRSKKEVEIIMQCQKKKEQNKQTNKQTQKKKVLPNEFIPDLDSPVSRLMNSLCAAATNNVNLCLHLRNKAHSFHALHWSQFSLTLEIGLLALNSLGSKGISPCRSEPFPLTASAWNRSDSSRQSYNSNSVLWMSDLESGNGMILGCAINWPDIISQILLWFMHWNCMAFFANAASLRGSPLSNMEHQSEFTEASFVLNSFQRDPEGSWENELEQLISIRFSLSLPVSPVPFFCQDQCS